MPAGTEASNPLPVLDANRRVVGRAALVVRREHLPGRFGNLGFVLRDGAYVPLIPPDARAERVLRELRAAYGRAKAMQLADWRRLRCAIRGGAAIPTEVTCRLVRNEAPIDWAAERPRRGRPPKWLVAQRANGSSAA